MLELMAGMMHLTSGGAPRAEEAIQTRILEGKEGKRNLFWIRGKLAWVLEYNKSKSQSVGRFQFVNPKSLTWVHVARLLQDSSRGGRLSWYWHTWR